MHTDLRTIKREVMGNGQEGLSKSVPRLSVVVESLEETVKDLKTVASASIRFQSELEGSHEGKAEVRKRNRWIIGILITALVSIFGTLVYLIEKV